ncbi:MAG TPA: hypothetical protein VKU90_00470 [Caulobacteraceae bacterium]|nr:hypothetical protein [Caulobacteraceae bacterium]
MFHAWENFYFLVGSAAAGLIGLLFVVVTLTSNVDRTAALRGSRLYMMPTVFHFAIVLTVSAVAVAPGVTPALSAIVLGLLALAGVANGVVTCVGIRRGVTGASEPRHWSDIWFYGVAAPVVDLGLLVAAVGLWREAAWAVSAVAVLLLVQLILGIRNAWDLVTFLAPGRSGPGSAP